MRRQVLIVASIALALAVVFSWQSWLTALGGIPTYGPRSGTIQIRELQTVKFYAEGRVALQNRVGFCLKVAPEGAFKMSWNENGRTYWIEAKSGKRELATVTSLEAADCPQ